MFNEVKAIIIHLLALSAVVIYTERQHTNDKMFQPVITDDLTKLIQKQN